MKISQLFEYMYSDPSGGLSGDSEIMMIDADGIAHEPLALFVGYVGSELLSGRKIPTKDLRILIRRSV